MELLEHAIEVNVKVSFVVYINSLQSKYQPSEDRSWDELGGYALGRKHLHAP